MEELQDSAASAIRSVRGMVFGGENRFDSVVPTDSHSTSVNRLPHRGIDLHRSLALVQSMEC
jgi:hypothetical protein